MRQVVEATKGRRVDDTDGVKVFHPPAGPGPGGSGEPAGRSPGGSGDKDEDGAEEYLDGLLEERFGEVKATA